MGYFPRRKLSLVSFVQMQLFVLKFTLDGHSDIYSLVLHLPWKMFLVLSPTIF